MNAVAWTALGTWVLVIGTLIAVHWQVCQNRQINSANTVMILHDRFESSTMRNYRKQICNTLISGNAVNQCDDHILVFFETLGLLTHRHIIDEDMVWNEFCWEVVRYYVALTKPRDHLAELRSTSHDKTLYWEFEWLFNRLIALDCRKRRVGKEVAIPNGQEVIIFVKEEVALTT